MEDDDAGGGRCQLDTRQRLADVTSIDRTVGRLSQAADGLSAPPRPAMAAPRSLIRHTLPLPADVSPRAVLARRFPGNANVNMP